MSKMQKIEGFLDRLERAEALLLEGRVQRLEGLPQAVAEGKPLPEVVRLNAEGEAARKGG